MPIHHYERELGLTEKYFWEKPETNEIRASLWKEQREKYGFDARETWGLNYTIAAFIYPRLKMFQAKSYSCPMGLSSEEWSEMVGKMAYAFGRILKEDVEDHWEEVEEGLNLFREYFFDLWD